MGRVIKDLRLGQSVSEHIGAEGKHRTDSPEHNNQGTSRVSGDHADRSRADIALDAEQGARLARTIEGEIIPRLKLAHGGEAPAQGTADGGSQRFQVLVTGGNTRQANARLRTLQRQGFEGFLHPRRD